ncbi:probable phosphoinositide phosphatase SAC1 at N-terminal half [Coccomyxa sp. Obi]|nr:probable phosphoinositide phosphatase SAC1 at N-terminal half [Coccomyxa sp. Obi]
MGEVALRKFYLYSTIQRLYLVARSKDRQSWRLVKFNRDPVVPTELEAVEDPVTYSEKEMAMLLSQISAGNAGHGGIKFELTADAVVGCFALLEGCYLLLVTKKRLHGSVCGRKVYGIARSQLIPISRHADSQASSAERRYKKMMQGIELSKDFLWSYTWPLWRTVQANMSAELPESAYDSMFVWNEFLTRQLRTALGNDRWSTPLVHGFWQQRSLAVLGRALTVTLIARRSRHFAGTRYRKRGVNDAGRVANEVEIEQVVDAGFDWRTGFPLLASLVQIRGSIPLYWVQDTTSVSPINPKPAIQLQQYDPHYSATRLHFQDLAARYGKPIIVLNLVKSAEKRPRESILQAELARAIEYINKGVPADDHVRYIPWDFKYYAKLRGGQILSDIVPVMTRALDETNFFLCAPAVPSSEARRTNASDWEPEVQRQLGILRTNCIDCLDRTNVAQFAAGLSGLGRQLVGLGLAARPDLDPRSSAATQLMAMYESMGNTLARQYGGSGAHAAVFKHQRGDWQAATRVRDKLISLRRAINNGWYDDEKQGAINLFLGHYQPCLGQSELWNLDSDHYLHSGLGRRSLLPSIPETILNSSTSADTPQQRKAVEASIMPQASELLPEMSTGSFEASKSVLAMRRAASDTHPFLSRSIGADEDPDPHTPRAAETHATAATRDRSPHVATSPFQEAAVNGLGPQAASGAGPVDAAQRSAVGASSQTAELGHDAATEGLVFVMAEAGEFEAAAAAAEVGKAAAADKDKVAEAEAAARSAAEGRLRAAAALAIRHSSGAEANSRAGSLDLGMLPPREMQVDVAPDLKSQASAASLESALSIAKLYDSQTSLNRLPGGSSLATRRSSLALADTPAPAETQTSAPSTAPEPSAEASQSLPAADSAVTTTDVQATQAADEAEAAAEAQAELGGATEENEEVAAKGSGHLTGLLRYRAPIQPLQSGKLESFDRKIGRAANALREVRLDTALPAKSYFPSWMRSRMPSNDAELGATSALATPNLANTIHGSLHGGNAFADHQWATTGGASQRRPNQAGLAPPSGLLVLGARAQSSPLEEPLHEGVASALSSPLATSRSATAAWDCSDEDPAPAVAAKKPRREPQTLTPGVRRRSFPSLPLASLWGSRSAATSLTPSQAMSRDNSRTSVASAGYTNPRPATSDATERVHGPNLGVFLSDDAEKVKRLGLPAGLVPYWQADDPSDAWYAADKQARAVYTKLFEVAEAQLQEAAAGQLRSTYCNLTNPALTVSLEGFADGKGSEWRHAFGLVGARTFGEKELQKLAFNQQAATTA